MVKKPQDLEVTTNVKMRGGIGSIDIHHLATKEEMIGKNRLFAKVIVKPGDSIGYHVHEDEMEAYCIIAGKGLYNDNGKEVEVQKGDVTITPVGHGHSIVNTGEDVLEIIALIPVA